MSRVIEGDIGHNSASQETPPKKRSNIVLLLIYIACTTVGALGGPLLQRLYYNHGGSLKWLQTLLVSIGFVATIPFISVLYLQTRTVENSTPDGSIMDLKLFIFSCLMGLLGGLNNYMYSTGLAYIPISTSSLLFATQLAFTAVFAFFIVRQKFTFYSINSVLVMTLGAVVLALHTSSDRPPGVSKGKYWLGFFMTLGGAALWGVTAPLIEFAYAKSSNRVTILLVLQFQVVMNAFATLFSTVGMLASDEFKSIPREAREFDMGKGKYYLILVSTTLIWQLSTIGVLGVISCTSSLFNGILSSILLPLTEVAAVIAFGEKFTGEKGLSLALCLWGFTSYFAGEYKKYQQPKPIVDYVTGVQDPRTTDLELTSQVANGV